MENDRSLSSVEIKKIAEAKARQAKINEDINTATSALKKMRALRAQELASKLEHFQSEEFRTLKDLWSAKFGMIAVPTLDELFTTMEDHIDNLKKMIAD